MVTAEEVAAGIVFLAQPGNNSSVGSFLTIDGGMATVRRLAPRPLSLP